MDKQNTTAFYMAAIDGGYCALKRSNELTVLFASPQVGRLLNVTSILHFSDFLSNEDRIAFFNAFRSSGLFSVKCNLRCGASSFVPVTLKCNTIGNIIYCLITTQIDWYNYATKALRAKHSYDRLLEHTDSFLFETDMNWNFVTYTGKVAQLFPIEFSSANLANFLTDPTYVSEDCSAAVSRLLAINTMFVVDVVEKIKIRFEGEWTWFEVRIQSVVNKSTNVIDGIIGSFTNIDAYQKNLISVNRQLSKDSVTSCFRREYLFNEKVVATMSSMSWFLLIKVNGLYEVKEQYGRDTFDAVLRDVAEKTMKEFASLPGLVCRYGDDELGVFVPRLKRAKLRVLIDRYVRSVQRIELDNKFPVTVSLCAVRNKANSMQFLTDKADNLLYSRGHRKGNVKIVE